MVPQEQVYSENVQKFQMELAITQHKIYHLQKFQTQ